MACSVSLSSCRKRRTGFHHLQKNKMRRCAFCFCLRRRAHLATTKTGKYNLFESACDLVMSRMSQKNACQAYMRRERRGSGVSVRWLGRRRGEAKEGELTPRLLAGSLGQSVHDAHTRPFTRVCCCELRSSSKSGPRPASAASFLRKELAVPYTEMYACQRRGRNPPHSLWLSGQGLTLGSRFEPHNGGSTRLGNGER